MHAVMDSMKKEQDESQHIFKNTIISDPNLAGLSHQQDTNSKNHLRLNLSQGLAGIHTRRASEDEQNRL